MYDIKPLEDDWKKYQFKKRKPWFLFIIFFIFIFLMAFYVVDTMHKDNKLFDNIFSKSTNIRKVKTTITKILVNGSLQKLEIRNESNTESIFSKRTSDADLLVDIPILDVDNTKVDNKNNAKVTIDIMKSTSISAYKDVENRFKQTNDIDDALFLAKSYYAKGNFEKSEYWAFEVNKLDSSVEESLFIFVKSKFKLGKKNEAISILNSYRKQNNSYDTSVLLEKLNNDKL